MRESVPRIAGSCFREACSAACASMSDGREVRESLGLQGRRRIAGQSGVGSRATTRRSGTRCRALTSFANIKIRSRMIHLYFEAETQSMIVAGTTNRTEFLLGDFCKFGDGGTDLEPLSHLYKDQIYQLAEHLDVTLDIRKRTPSPDTFSLPVSDQEFFFRIPFDKLDMLLYAWEHEVPTSEAATVTRLDEDAVKRAYADFSSKYRATQHLRDLPYSLPFTQ